MGDRVEGFGKVYCHGHRSVWWPGLIETQGHFVYEGEEGSGGGVLGSESMLGFGKGKGV